MRNKILYLILGIAFILRWMRPDLVGFYFDQGRDGLVIWDLLYKTKLFLIGPTTGIEGIFLGPFYYYLITPAYWLGGGDPVFPIRFLALLNLGSLILLYKLGEVYFSRFVGLTVVILSGFSYQFIIDNRWLSNPTPLTFFSLLTMWFLAKVIHGNLSWFPAVCFLIGLCLQLEAASAIFFIPSLLFTLLIFWRQIKLSMKYLLLGVSSFAVTLMPQIWFDFRHQHILSSALYKFLVSEKSFSSSPLLIIPSRLKMYFDAFTQRLTPADLGIKLFLFMFIIIAMFKLWPKLIQNKLFKTSLIWLLTPLVFLLLYTGNHGYVWDYYFTGVYPIFFLLAATVIRKRLASLVFIGIFLFTNLPPLQNYFGQTGLINLGTSLTAVDWVYNNSAGIPFNIDVYVPPVIPYAYDYLFKWRGVTKYKTTPTDTRIKNLYTLFEMDPGHPQLLQKWKDRQDGIAKIMSEQTFGAIIVQRRERINL